MNETTVIPKIQLTFFTIHGIFYWMVLPVWNCHSSLKYTKTDAFRFNRDASVFIQHPPTKAYHLIALLPSISERKESCPPPYNRVSDNMLCGFVLEGRSHNNGIPHLQHIHLPAIPFPLILSKRLQHGEIQSIPHPTYEFPLDSWDIH